MKERKTKRMEARKKKGKKEITQEKWKNKNK
jgi:hypothetical protein